jgi:4-amino-4-deoxychorismate lyase
MLAQGSLSDERHDFGLIETLLWTRDCGYWLAESHRARMASSAFALGFAFSAEAFDEELARACAGEDVDRLRVRLVLGRNGVLDVSTKPFAPDPPQKVWRIAVAPLRLDSRDDLLRHKTTRRALYEDALAESTADEVIFLNEHEQICEGARTNIFVEREGQFLTPTVTSGLLPGVLRGHFLAEGLAREAVIRLQDLDGRFYIGNSLRGLLPARLT